MPPLKLRRLSVVLEVPALNCLRFLYLFLDLSLSPVVAGVVSVGALGAGVPDAAGALSFGALVDILDVEVQNSILLLNRKNIEAQSKTDTVSIRWCTG